MMLRFAPHVLAAAVTAALPAAAAAKISVGVDARAALSLTLYQGDLALVSERRRAPFQKGTTTLAFDHVSRHLDPTSVRIHAGPDSRVEEIDLEADLLTPEALLARSVGRRIGVVKTHPTTGVETVVEATVLSVSGGTVLRMGERIETGRPGRLVFFDQPPDLRPRPALLARVHHPAGGSHEVDIAYLTRGMGWTAHHTIELAPDGRHLDLDTWASLRNHSGIAFDRARVHLVAGDVRQPAPRRQLMQAAMAAPAMTEAKAALPQRQSLAAFHMYTMPRPLDLGERELKQVALLAGRALAVERRLLSRGSPPVFGAQRGTPPPAHPEVRLVFRNGGAEGSAEPLPAGPARVYVRDASGDLRFAGEDRIANTPVGGTVSLRLGRAFDVRVKRTQTAFRRHGKRTTESAYRLELENGGEREAAVRIEETIPGDWRITEESATSRRRGAAAVWRLSVPARGTADLTYRVRVDR